MSLKFVERTINPVLGEDDAQAEGVLSPFEGADEGGDALKVLGLPSANSMFAGRDVRADEDAGPAVFASLTRVYQALQELVNDGRAWRFRIDHLAETDRKMLLDALGDGEVSVVITGVKGEGDVQISESVLPGVWKGRAETTEGTLGAEWIEVGAAPRALRELAATRPRDTLPVETLTPPRGAMNVMSVLAEIKERAAEWQPGVPNHVFNFTLFPMSPADSAFLAKTLGESGVRVSSGGYGAARVIMTGIKNVWAVQYLNGLGTVILDTIEVGDVPDAVLASQEDFEDSADRLSNIVEAYSK
ncbi:MAG: hydrogenase expression/formation protein [Pseudomonadota bacterium]